MESESQPESSAIKLWNPNAAANLAILFSPIFSAWLMAKNWHELGKPDEAKKSMMWVKIWIGFLPVYLLVAAGSRHSRNICILNSVGCLVL